jgi:hypothetical protein
MVVPPPDDRVLGDDKFSLRRFALIFSRPLADF